MSYQTFVVPYLRASPVRVPRRDMVLGLVDSLALTVQVVDQDNPDGVPLAVSGGIGGYVLQMIVWPDGGRGWGWDYGCGVGWDWGRGAPVQRPWSVLWVGTGTVVTGTPGAFLLAFPTNTMSSWPRRCRYALQLDWNSAGDTELLAEGNLHLVYSASRAVFPIVMLTDPTPPVLTDDAQDYILLDGVSSP